MAEFNGLSELDRLTAALTEFEKDAVVEVQNAAMVVTRSFFSNTPVWSGETVRNYSWGAGGMPGGGTKGSSGPLPAKGDFSEGNRGANEAGAIADMEGVIPRDHLVDLFLTNTVDIAKWELIDAGLAPWPGASRYPGGVEVISVQTARAQLKNWK